MTPDNLVGTMACIGGVIIVLLLALADDTPVMLNDAKPRPTISKWGCVLEITVGIALVVLWIIVHNT